jgi:hypothetical protein
MGDEVKTLAGPKTIKWIGYNKFIKDEGRAWHANVSRSAWRASGRRKERTDDMD